MSNGTNFAWKGQVVMSKGTNLAWKGQVIMSKGTNLAWKGQAVMSKGANTAWKGQVIMSKGTNLAWSAQATPLNKEQMDSLIPEHPPSPPNFVRVGIMRTSKNIQLVSHSCSACKMKHCDYILIAFLLQTLPTLQCTINQNGCQDTVVSNSVFYAQSTSAVISGRRYSGLGRLFGATHNRKECFIYYFIYSSHTFSCRGRSS